MHRSHTTHKRVLFGTVMTFGMIAFTVVLLVPILVTQSKYTITATMTVVNTTITTSTSTTTASIILSSSSSSSTTSTTSTTTSATSSTTSTTSTTTSATSSTTSATSSTTSTTTSSTSSTSSTTAFTVTLAEAQLALGSIDGIVHGVYNTTVGGDSLASTPGFNIGNYPAGESPGNACDNNTFTKYLNFGSCSEIQWLERCGLDTGFYLELMQGVVLVTGIRICTAADYPERDPLVVSLEGSQQSGTALTFGSSWSLIYRGSTGLAFNPGRGICDTIQRFNNSVPYKSYRFLVLEKRAISNSVQYGEVQLFTS